MTTGGASEVAAGVGVMPDRHGAVNTQQRPSAKSKNDNIGKIRYCSKTSKHTQNKLCVVCINFFHTLTLYCYQTLDVVS